MGGYTLHLLFLLLMCVMSITGPLLGQRGWPEGDHWLKWNQDAREKYVWGYTTAYAKGYGTACRQVDLAWTGNVQPGYENAVLNKCMKEQLDFSKGSDYLIKSVTDFYRRYPKDRDISIGELLDLLGKGLAVEEIHNQRFQGHTPPGAKP